MTCASCVRRVEWALEQTAGVESAAVNLATEQATLRYLPNAVGAADLVAVIEKAGYGVRPRAEGSAEDAEAAEAAQQRHELLILKLKIGASLGVAPILMFLMFWPTWLVDRPFDEMEAIFLPLFLLATPIQFWDRWTFYRQAWAAARHGSTNMATLVVLGTTAAWGYSTFVTFATERVHQSGLMAEVYFDSAAVRPGSSPLISTSRANTPFTARSKDMRTPACAE